MCPQKRTPAKKRRAPVKEPGIAKRLGLLRKADESDRAFAARLDVDFRRLGEWLRGARAPSAASLRIIAKQTAVSLDWLLDGLGHNKAMSADPVYRGQYRNDVKLEDDLAEHIRKEVGKCLEEFDERWLLRQKWLDSFDVNAGAILATMVEAVRAEAFAYDEWVRMDFNRAELARELAAEAIGEMPPVNAKSFKGAYAQAMLSEVPVLVAGLCAPPPVRRYVTPKRGAGPHPQPLPEERYQAWRSSKVNVTALRSGVDRVGSVEVNSVEVYREHRTPAKRAR